MVRLSGKVAAITGGARGIGFATAEAFVRRGVRVAIGDLDVDEAQRAADRLGTDRCAAFDLDVTDTASFSSFLDRTEEAFGPLDILVNNAGIMLVGEFLKEDEAATDREIDINLRGVIRGCRLVLPGMLERSSGNLVNIASMAGKTGTPGAATYSATKHAVVGFSDSLRGELRDTGIQVHTIMPSVVNTRLGAGTGETIVKTLEPSDVAEVIVQVLENDEWESTVPRWLPWIVKPTMLLPSKARDWVSKVTGAADVLLGADATAREEYERTERGG